METLVGSDDTINMDSSSSTATVFGGSDVVSSAYSGNVIGFAGSDDTAQVNGGLIYLDNGSTSALVEGNNDTVNSGFSGNTVGFTGTSDLAQITDGTILTNSTSAASLKVQGSGDSETTISGTGQSYTALDAQTISDIDAIDNAVLDRDAGSADLVSAQMVLASGGGLAGVMSAVASSAEAQADMASTYAAEGVVLTAPNSTLSELAAALGLNTTNTPTQAEFAAFADAMSTSYGAPITLFSVDPDTGQQTVLADTSITNLLAELPVLETTAGGVNLGLQLADGSQLTFSNTAGVADFLYALAVQQMQATSFVTDNFNLDVQWLNTVDQPLLNEAVGWTEQSATEAAAASAQTALAAQESGWSALEAEAEASSDTSLAQEYGTEAYLAMQIAAEAPASRQDASVTINNSYEDCQTQVTVYANGSGGTIHDIDNSNPWTYVEEVASTILNVVAVFVPALAPLAMAVDAAEAGQDFANGKDLQGILSLAQAVGAGLAGAAGAIQAAALATAGEGEAIGAADAASVLQGMELSQSLQTAAQAVSAASQVVGGIYGAVTSAEDGNDFGIVAGALEAAAGAAAGIGVYDPDLQQTMNALAQDVGTAGIVASMAGAFESGNIAQGLIDSLNIYLPAVAQAYASEPSDNNITTGNDTTSDVFIGASDVVTEINFGIITANEGGISTSGYVPNQNGTVLENSGMTIGAGIDIGNQSLIGLEGMETSVDLSPALVEKLAPYIGITGQPALTFIQANPITLSNEEVTNLDEAFWAYQAQNLATEFNSAQNYGAGFTFGMLPTNTQTALADMYWHYANKLNGFLATTQLWTQITTGNWQAAINNIDTWSSSSASRNQAMGNLIQQDFNAGLLPTPAGAVH